MWHRALNILIGGLLAATAFAKLWQIKTDPFADVHSGLPIGLIWTGIAVELAVVAVLVRARSSVLKSLVAVTVFTVFFCISLYKFVLVKWTPFFGPLGRAA
jgi:hypothetical protein